MRHGGFPEKKKALGRASTGEAVQTINGEFDFFRSIHTIVNVY
jgi:hypothetical protein